MEPRDPLSKKYYRIREVSEILGIPATTLRFWESRIPAIHPRRNDHGTRFYTPQDIDRLRQVRFLVKDRGMKIETAVQEMARDLNGVARRAAAIDRLRIVRARLQQLLDQLDAMR